MAIVHNPLIIPILHFIKQQRAAVTEHELLTALQQQGEFDGLQVAGLGATAASNDLALFRRHFLIMNALYQLQQQLLADGLHLQISPLCIQLAPLAASHGSSLADVLESPALAEYYGDLSNLADTDEGDVQQLLTGFWQRYLAEDKQVEAYQQLGLPVDASWQEVKLAYRRLAKQYHPDHGGDHEQFIALRSAFEVLAQVLN
ncbi:DnaJ domain-containing protein [Dasania sp. GY-MA-18]|uniref:DnaJ domain-containing protein n=1 Tax=Dasania phycosphaerae TaxID=2950436 RepID=A0A9J6RHG3_9GAMM|nr:MULTISPECIES: DNA-J related domain-containing protein [Dasania]MCR8921463.1 DnaJ domain-containing protein [Dasania sp. GY-MA-18]MCZ0863891.1 DnaJ domain-containing protein [Dasania phycosphaerae]MCZ0867619.1 DnaJ domain-containing protein [Dasania phycosphaerae]